MSNWTELIFCFFSSNRPCLNGGICHDRIANYHCECPPGKTGLLCHLNDACASNPCNAAAICDTSIVNGSYTCRCPGGFSGTDCNEDINECLEGEAFLFVFSFNFVKIWWIAFYHFVSKQIRIFLTFSSKTLSFQVHHVNTEVFVSTHPDRTNAIAQPGSGVGGARSTSTSVRQTHARTREPALTSGVDSDASACLVRLLTHLGSYINDVMPKVTKAHEYIQVGGWKWSKNAWRHSWMIPFSR